MITILMIFGNVIDNIITSKKAYDSGASIWSVIVSLIAGVIGAIIWTPIGGLLVAPVALFLAEYYRQKDWRKGLATTRGWLVGLGWSFIIRFLTGMAMIGLWLIWALNTH